MRAFAALLLASVLSAPATTAEVCFSEPVESDVDLSNSRIIDWQSDPNAVGYCAIDMRAIHLCDKPDPSTSCSSTFREFAGGRVVKVLEFVVEAGSAFALIGIQGTSGCTMPEGETRYLALDGAFCAFRPIGLD